MAHDKAARLAQWRRMCHPVSLQAALKQHKLNKAMLCGSCLTVYMAAETSFTTSAEHFSSLSHCQTCEGDSYTCVAAQPVVGQQGLIIGSIVD